MLTQKVNITDLASLMPSSDGSDTANFMAKLLEMQSRLKSIESKVSINRMTINKTILIKKMN